VFLTPLVASPDNYTHNFRRGSLYERCVAGPPRASPLSRLRAPDTGRFSAVAGLLPSGQVAGGGLRLPGAMLTVMPTAGR
jgi:hypothetical protein